MELARYELFLRSTLTTTLNIDLAYEGWLQASLSVTWGIWASASLSRWHLLPIWHHPQVMRIDSTPISSTVAARRGIHHNSSPAALLNAAGDDQARAHLPTNQQNTPGIWLLPIFHSLLQWGSDSTTGGEDGGWACPHATCLWLSVQTLSPRCSGLKLRLRRNRQAAAELEPDGTSMTQNSKIPWAHGRCLGRDVTAPDTLAVIIITSRIFG